MSLGLMMHGNWDGLSMAPPQLQSYKPERPVYSTPHPVQSTPANNECKLVELRGAEVASFLIGDEEYICLPQAFDLFLKHLVGGLHTVYTKLKRLNITPVVCNVEQVRVLRGLGAIQPGVNRCKLITRKDFEVLYQDCTTASRPGRPPKRFPILPPSELMSHHHGARAMNPPRLHNSPDLSSFYKRMRMDPEANFHQQQPRRISTSPTRRSSPTARTSGADELYANAANIYLQQALRQQYQQFIANGLHNNMNAQHGPMNAALAPLIGMSNHGLFNGAIPPNLLNHINEYARANGREIQNSSMNSEGHRSAAASPREEKAENPDKYRSPEPRNSSLKYEPPMDGGLAQRSKSPAQEDRSMKSPHHRFDTKVHDSRHSPVTPNSMTGRNSVGGASVSSYDSGKKSPTGQTYNHGIHSPRDDSEVFDAENMTQAKYDVVKEEQEKIEAAGSPNIDNRKNNWQASPEGASISSMQTLLSNIQGLLKVAADNAKLQDKQLSFEIAELKNRISKEQELRGMAERKLEESEKIRASIQRKLNREREAVKRLQERKLSTHEKLQHIDGTDKPSDVDVTSSPSEPRSQPCSPASNTDAHSGLHLQADSTVAVPTSMESNMSSEFSPVASSPSAVSPVSVNECLSYWPTRPLALDTSSQRNRSASHSPEHSSPVNMATAERNWMSHSLVQSSSCAK